MLSFVNWMLRLLEIWPQLLLISVIVFAAQLVYNRYFHPLSGIPGPFWASISKFWSIWHTSRGRVHVVHVASHRKYGQEIRLSHEQFIIHKLIFASVYWQVQSSEHLQIAS